MRVAPPILAALLLLAPTPATAQTEPWEWGFVGGPNLSSVSNIIAGTYRTGYSAGITAQRPLAGPWWVVVEAVWIAKGVKSGQSGGSGSVEVDYLELPVLARAFLSSGGTKPFVEAGAAVATKAGCSVSGSTGSSECGVWLNFTSTDRSLLGGIGVQRMIHGNPWTLDLRYDYGLNEVVALRGARNTSVQLLLAVRL